MSAVTCYWIWWISPWLILRWLPFIEPLRRSWWWILCLPSLIQVFVEFIQLLLDPLQYDQLSSGCCNLIQVAVASYKVQLCIN